MLAARTWVIGASLLALGAVGGGLLWQSREERVKLATLETAHQIESAIEKGKVPDDAPWQDRRARALVKAFYTAREMRPAWTTGAGATEQARQLADVLLRAREEGLESVDYSAAQIAARLEIHEQNGTENPQTLADFDVLCTIAALRYMSDVFDGRISPKSLDAKWVTEPRKGDLHAMLEEALARGDVAKTLTSLPPTYDGYTKLREARARYAKLVASGGWKPIPAGPALKVGAKGPRVTALRERLTVTGELDASASTGESFDETLATAVKRFQARYGRDENGVIEATELAELNVSAETRLRQIELNMERWRWLPRTLGDPHLIVNIPEYTLHIMKSGREELEMRVVVGKVLNATPVFSDQMTQVVVNPTWNVPESIAVGEIAPLMQKDASYLSKQSMRVFDGQGDDAQEVDPASIDWSDSEAVKKLSFRQDPGAHNALGRIKFLFPNQFNVYLHDTPQGHLFSREERSFSHGCVRVEKPLELAEYVLQGTPEGDRERLEALIAEGKTRTFKVPEPLPVHIVYFTAFADADGTTGFREDVYGIDTDLGNQLRGHARELAK